MKKGIKFLSDKVSIRCNRSTSLMRKFPEHDVRVGRPIEYALARRAGDVYTEVVTGIGKAPPAYVRRTSQILFY